MLFRLFTAVLAVAVFCSVHAMPGLPADVDVDESVPAPAEVLGFEPGQWHPRHDQIVTYMRALAEASDRVMIEEIGATHGQRPLIMLTFAAPDRLADIDAIRDRRREASRAGDGPPVIWLGYSVHGNEASGASAALVTAWYLAASRDQQVLDWLDELVIVMEPAINPDGIDRFAHWVNMHRGRNPSSDPADREHGEGWPSGRTNYYWFDLNRDWMPLVHPESRARVGHYHDWRPHVLTDHHEMGRNSTFFFQPGVAERANPLMPERNQQLTAEIAEYHGRYLDRAQSAYYSGESFDDFYIGKGSTYPDLTGGIGILFEQGSSRGHVQASDYGTRSFADAVANQVITSLSTLAASHALGDELIAFQRDFFAGVDDQVRAQRTAGWLLGDGGDPARARALVGLLLNHEISVHPVEEPVEIDGREHRPGAAWVIPAEQDHFRLLRSLLEVDTELEMETFYDVSAWPLGLAHDLPLADVSRLPDHGEALGERPAAATGDVATDSLAWIVPWDQYRAPALLAALQAEGYRVQATLEPLTVAGDRGQRELVRGSLVVHAGHQPDELSPVGETLATLAGEHDVEVITTGRGLAVDGVDLGSPSVPMLDEVRPAVLTGPGLSAYHVGYIWHWFDTRLEQPLTRLDWERLFRAELDDYTHLILPEGNYEFLPPWAVERITGFVRDGGVLLALRGASTWVEGLELEWTLAGDDDAGEDDEEDTDRRAYADFQDDFARELIGGAALGIELDTTHPLGFGYHDGELAVFRRGRHVLAPVENAYTQAAIYADEPLAAGYLSSDNRERLAGTPAISASRHGAGTVVRMADDALFRGYWRGSEKLFANALYFSELIRNTQLPDDE